jgi:thioredoxin 2
VNSDDNPRTAVAHRIRSVPTLLLLRAGHEVKRQSGLMQARELARWVEA